MFCKPFYGIQILMLKFDRKYLGLFLATLIVLASLPAAGRSVSPYSWQEVAYYSDFFGVVRCTKSEYPKGKSRRGHNQLFFKCKVVKS